MRDHRRIYPESQVDESTDYIVVGVPKDGDGDDREAFSGTFDECQEYKDRNESPDNYERYYVAKLI